MKKRIFSLAMVCLFILTALCAVPTFAEDAEANLIDGTKVDFGVGHATSYEVKNKWGDNSTEGDYISTEGLLEFGSSNHVVYDVYAKEEGYYAFSMYAGTTFSLPRYDFEVDGNTVISYGSDPAPTYNNLLHATKYQLPIVKLTEGAHTIKITFREFGGFFYGICVESAEANDVSYADETILSAKNDVAFHSANGVEDTNATSGVINTDGRLKIYTNGKAYYLINVPEAGKYNIGIVAASEINLNMKLTTEGGSVSGTFKPEETSITHGTKFSFGTVELKKGLQFINFEMLNTTWGYLYLYGVTLKNEINLIDGTKVDFGVGHATSYDVKNKWGENSTEGDYISTEGTLEFGSSNHVVYDVYAKEEGYYAFSMYAGTTFSLPRYDFEVDGNTVISSGSDTAPTYDNLRHATKYQLPTVKLTEGAHTIKITFREFGGWFYGICAEAAEANDVSYADETILSAKNDVAFHSANGIEDTNATSGIINTDGRLKIYTNGKAYYLINVPEAGKYNIGIVAASDKNLNMKLTTESGSLSKTFVPKEYTDAYGTAFEFGTVELNKGLQFISFEMLNTTWGNLYLYGVTIKNAAHMLSTSDKVTISACSFSSKVTSQEEVWPNDSSKEGIEVTGLVVARGGYSYSYSINVPESGNYVLSMISGGGPIDGSILDAKGNVLLSGRLSERTSGTGYAAETESGTITLPKGINTITISVSDAATYLYSIGFRFVAPNVAVFEGEIADNMYAYEVVEGTMSFKAEMNGYLAGKNALVVFAIYETDENGVKKLYNAYAEIKEGGQTVMGAINDIVLDDEKTYSAKVFMIDSETLSGKVIDYIG